MSCFVVFYFLREAEASLQAETGNLICDLLLDKEWREMGTGEVEVCDKDNQAGLSRLCARQSLRGGSAPDTMQSTAMF